MDAAGVSSGARRHVAVSCEAELVAEYLPLARYIARDFYLPGGNEDDLLQEALLGVLSAIRTWRPDGGAPLRSLIALAVRRQLATAVKTARRAKHVPLTDSIRELHNDDGELVDITDLIADRRADPHDRLVGRLELAEALDRIGQMSELERAAVIGFAVGLSYDEIRAHTGRNLKSVDNAFQRARRHLRSDDDLKEAA